MNPPQPPDAEMTPLPFILRVLKAFADNEDCDSLSWQVKGESVTFWVNCNDLFWWGTADAEEVTPENIGVYEEAVQQLSGIGYVAGAYAATLFCCRVRNMRPQGCCYPVIQNGESLWALFDACGPERAIEFGNPYSPGKK